MSKKETTLSASDTKKAFEVFKANIRKKWRK